MAAAEHPSDDELIAGTARGVREAFAALYRRRRADVYRFALHVSGSPPVADDVTQDVFMAVIRDAQRYQPGRAGPVSSHGFSGSRATTYGGGRSASDRRSRCPMTNPSQVER